MISETIVPNDNITVPYGPLTLTRMVFDMLEMDRPLSKLKRRQGVTPSEVIIALVSHAMQMRGLSINRLEDVINDKEMRMIHGLSDEVDKNDLYRMEDALGENVEPVIEHIDRMLKDKLGLSFDTVFIDWSATYFEAKPTKLIRFGFTKDHRSDRPQISIGLAMDAATRIPIGFTIMPGNTLDVTHFKASFEQISPFLDENCLIVFDNGGYSDENAKMITSKGFHFLTRAQMNKSNDKRISSSKTEWRMVEDGICAHTFQGNLGYTKCIYFSASKWQESMEKYRDKANRDYDEMLEMKAALEGRRKLRKKYRNSNYFVDTRLSYLFQLDGMSREEAIERAIRNRITGREGYFVLMSSKEISAKDMLKTYRSRNDVEGAYRDLKHGIDIRPTRTKKEAAIKGRVMITFLAYFVLALAKFMVPEMQSRTADTLVEELRSFSVTTMDDDKGGKRRVYSNFGPMIRRIFERIPLFSSILGRGIRLGKGKYPTFVAN